MSMATEFGKRLSMARQHAKLTQVQLRLLVGMSQSTISAAELKGEGSRKTPQIAAACGVSAHWLATGEGSMLDGVRRAADPAAADAIEGAEASAGQPVAPVSSVAHALIRLGAELALLPAERRAELTDALTMWVKYGDAYRGQVEQILTAPDFQQSLPRKSGNG